MHWVYKKGTALMVWNDVTFFDHSNVSLWQEKLPLVARRRMLYTWIFEQKSFTDLDITLNSKHHVITVSYCFIWLLWHCSNFNQSEAQREVTTLAVRLNILRTMLSTEFVEKWGFHVRYIMTSYTNILLRENAYLWWQIYRYSPWEI